MIEEVKYKYDDIDNIEETKRISSDPIFLNLKAEKPKFTIAIPTYKRANLLRFALESCINQLDFFDYEILVVDNNPERNDETEILMLSYYQHNNISYYKNSKNIGMTGNWNKLYILSRTEWVIMLHDDDMLYPDFMRTIADIINKDKEAVCIYNCYNTIKGMDNNQPYRVKKELKIMTLKEKDYLTGCHIHAPCGMTLKRNVVFELGGFNSSYYPSLDFHFHVKLAHYYTVRWLRGYPLATYRWMVNAGGKPETVPGWIEKDSKIKRLICKNNNISCKFMFESYLRHFNKLFVKNWNKKNSANLIEPKDYIYDYISYYFLKVLWGLPKKFRRINIYNIF